MTMADVKTQGEPSMEEILASIRRIIAEDEASPPVAAPVPPPAPRPIVAEVPPAPAMPPPPAAAAPSPTVATAQDAILDLTDRIDDDTPPKRPAAMPGGQGGFGARLNRPPPLKGAAPAAGPTEPPKRIVSDTTVAASVATLQHIASIGNTGRQQELPLGDVGRTLEEMVRELLRPHLKEWLDAHLPRLVERLVRDEINRLVRDAQER